MNRQRFIVAWWGLIKMRVKDSLLSHPLVLKESVQKDGGMTALHTPACTS